MGYERGTTRKRNAPVSIAHKPLEIAWTANHSSPRNRAAWGPRRGRPSLRKSLLAAVLLLHVSADNGTGIGFE